MAYKREISCRAWCLARHAEGLPTNNKAGARAGYSTGLLRRVREALADEGLVPRLSRGDAIRAGLARMGGAGLDALRAKRSAAQQVKRDTARKVEEARAKALELADTGLLPARSDLMVGGISRNAAQVALGGLRAEGRIDAPPRNGAAKRRRPSDSDLSRGYRGPGVSGRLPRPEMPKGPASERPGESKAEWLARMEGRIEAAAEANCCVTADPPRWRRPGREIEPAKWPEPLERTRHR